jgi:serine/threonine protein kinase
MLKIIDLGSARDNESGAFIDPAHYITTRPYRAPEVVLGAGFGCAVDMWALGCVAAELFLGTPLFPSYSSWEHLRRVITMFGYSKETSSFVALSFSLIFFLSPQWNTASAFAKRNFDQPLFRQLRGLETSKQTTKKKKELLSLTQKKKKIALFILAGWLCHQHFCEELHLARNREPHHAVSSSSFQSSKVQRR